MASQLLLDVQIGHGLRSRRMHAQGPRLFLTAWLLALNSFSAHASIPGAAPLVFEGDPSAEMVAGIDRFLMREITNSVPGRSRFWNRDFRSREAYERSVEVNRARLQRYVGAADPRLTNVLVEVIAKFGSNAVLAENAAIRITAVRWPVFEGVYGEGLLLDPKGKVLAQIIALPDADQTPEEIAGLVPAFPPELQFARRLAEQGCRVLVMSLVDRRDLHSGNSRIGRFTNQPHREWIYRQAYEMGRHLIGYEIQKVLAAVDWFEQQRRVPGQPAHGTRIGVAGYAEGGLLAFYSAALDRRIEAILVSGYFEPRERVWAEPIYRNVFALLQEFGDAEIASLITPRELIIEFSLPPQITGPPPRRDGRHGAAPGEINNPDFLPVEAEVRRAGDLVRELTSAPPIHFVYGAEGMPVKFGSEKGLVQFTRALGLTLTRLASSDGQLVAPADLAAAVEVRSQRQVRELEQFTQRLFRESERTRDALVWQKLRTADWDETCRRNRQLLWEEVIGKITHPVVAPNPRARVIFEQPKATVYEVMLEVFPDVFAWGYLLVPKDLAASERRPVVVCQHGLEGLPAHVVNTGTNQPGFAAYRGYATRLAERGFIVYAPHNPYRGEDKFRVLQRKANPLKLSLFSFIIAQHEVTLKWLGQLPFVDPARIGFYGLSYGGKTAMRVPAVLDGYCLSICSADFNEWIQKNVTVDSGYSYLFTGEYEMPEFNLGHTFNYAEMASLIAPRPFMVERGHFDGVAPDPWVAYEYAKVRRAYTLLGIPERSEIEFFNGPHAINGQGTFRFLHRHLNWPEPAP